MIARWAGWSFILAGGVLLGWVALVPLVEDRRTVVAQAALRLELEDGSQRPDDRGRPVADPAPEGEPLAEMRIPRLGPDWSWVALEGTSPEVLAVGPGHYAGTPLPGERGNVAFAAHRAGHGDPFLEFDTLRAGDEVTFHQGGTRWTYRLTSEPEIVPATADWVLDPVPGRTLTLTTCWPRYGSSKRMFVRGELVSVSSAGDGGSSDPGTSTG